MCQFPANFHHNFHHQAIWGTSAAPAFTLPLSPAVTPFSRSTAVWSSRRWRRMGRRWRRPEAVAEAMVKAIWRAGDGIFAGCFAGILMLFFRESLMCCFSSCCFGLCMSMYYLMNLMRFRGKSTLKLTTHIKHKHKSTAHACTNHPLLIGPVFVVSWFSQLNSRNMVGDTICYYLISIQ